MLVFKRFGCTRPVDETSDFNKIAARGYLVEAITTLVPVLSLETCVFKYGSALACALSWDVAILCPLCYRLGFFSRWFGSLINWWSKMSSSVAGSMCPTVEGVQCICQCSRISPRVIGVPPLQYLLLFQFDARAPRRCSGLAVGKVLKPES